MHARSLFPLLLAGLAAGIRPAPGQTEAGPWIDPAWSESRPGIPRAIIWFDRQLLDGGDAYARRTAELGAVRRRAFRTVVVDSLKRLNEASWRAAAATVTRLERDSVLTRCERHWIVNSVSCDVPDGNVKPLTAIPGAFRIYRDRSRPAREAPGAPVPAEVLCQAPKDDYRPDPARAPWSARMLKVDQVWRDLGLTGRGTLSVVHDFGWTLTAPPVVATLWCNAGEIPNNGKDDDGNGYVDDSHGYNASRQDGNIVGGNSRNLGLTHGDLTAAMLAGRDILDTAIVIGMAPGGRWAAVQGDIMAGVEWALTIGADTYSMSFSIPRLGEQRGHWRRVMEHGALAGLFFVSGAGNNGNPDSRNFVPPPEQMAIPEGVPLAVFGVSGVGRDGTRPVFSSQGPVVWETVDYHDGQVQKPDFATVNTNLLGIDSAGHALYRGPRGFSGNSFAGPHTAGILALMLEADPDLTPWVARDILVSTARDIDPPGVDVQTGAGLVDAYAAVLEVQRRAKERGR